MGKYGIRTQNNTLCIIAQNGQGWAQISFSFIYYILFHLSGDQTQLWVAYSNKKTELPIPAHKDINNDIQNHQ